MNANPQRQATKLGTSAANVTTGRFSGNTKEACLSLTQGKSGGSGLGTRRQETPSYSLWLPERLGATPLLHGGGCLKQTSWKSKLSGATENIQDAEDRGVRARFSC